MNTARPQIKDMKVNEVGYTVPWALLFDAKEQVWIRGDYSYRITEKGTSNMKVCRTSDGFTVSLPSGIPEHGVFSGIGWAQKAWFAIPVTIVEEVS